MLGGTQEPLLSGVQDDGKDADRNPGQLTCNFFTVLSFLSQEQII